MEGLSSNSLAASPFDAPLVPSPDLSDDGNFVPLLSSKEYSLYSCGPLKQLQSTEDGGWELNEAFARACSLPLAKIKSTRPPFVDDLLWPIIVAMIRLELDGLVLWVKAAKTSMAGLMDDFEAIYENAKQSLCTI